MGQKVRLSSDAVAQANHTLDARCHLGHAANGLRFKSGASRRLAGDCTSNTAEILPTTTTYFSFATVWLTLAEVLKA
jgi:hypothetical protein